MSQTGSFLTSLVWETSDAEGPTRAEYQTNWNAVDGHKHDNRGTGQGIRCLQTSSVPTQTGDVQINGDTLQWWGSTSNAVISAVTAASTVASLTFSGPAGVANTRFCGILSTSGAPTTGTWKQWDFGYDEGGGIFLCTVAGSPGTWIQVGGPMTGDLKATLRNTSDSGWALLYGQTVDGTTSTYANLWTYVNANGLVGGGKPFSGTQSALVLPDLRGYNLTGLDNMGGSAAGVLSALTALGTKTGSATHTLTTAELPHLSYTANVANAAVSLPNIPGGNGANGGTPTAFADASSNNGGNMGQADGTLRSTTVNVSDTNGGGSHSIVQPAYGVNVAVKL